MAGPNDLNPANTSNLYPVVITDAGQTAEYSSADLAQYSPSSDPSVNTLTAAGAIVSHSAMYSPVYGGYGTTAAQIAEANGSNVSFWWDGNGMHLQLNGGELLSWVHGLGKTFVIQHPLLEDRYLVHACFEGPEAAVYYRGHVQLDRRGRQQVELPDYFTKLVRAGTETVQVSAVLERDTDPFGPCAATAVKDGRFTIRGHPSQRIAWRVEGERADVPTLNVEPRRADVIVGGDGPYQWIR